MQLEQTTAELEAAGIRPLTDPERERLVVCEGVIKKGLNTFLEVGGALAEIHDAMLYRETHKSFKRYCKDVWDLGRCRAYQQMDGYRAVKLLEEKVSTIVDTFPNGEENENLCDVMGLDPNTLEPREVVMPTNEAQVRPLTRLSPDDQIKAWGLVLKQLNDGKKLTAALVGKAAKEIKGETQTRKIKETQQELEFTARLSNLMRRQLKDLTDTINEERNGRWQQSSRVETVKWLEKLIALAMMDV